MARSFRLCTVTTAVAAIALLAGCSQVSALAPVSGGHLAEVRYAAIDVLLNEGVDILTAPVCTDATDGAVTCEGATVDKQPIIVESPAADQTVVTITVGDRQLYSGSITDVLDAAARTGS